MEGVPFHFIDPICIDFIFLSHQVSIYPTTIFHETRLCQSLFYFQEFVILLFIYLTQKRGAQVLQLHTKQPSHILKPCLKRVVFLAYDIYYLLEHIFPASVEKGNI